ncbi:hypothetical protein ES288_A07G100100v1 [Gossypium darwinii]|uniref:Uncharacterized protein n=1 Tax=Gossypium darwinii TaxID=34276 RepID=A0A5D2FXM3_GOSDA|nr:hypothetical protein ES288_A07G100100v1 [Gossypium darwinii]
MRKKLKLHLADFLSEKNGFQIFLLKFFNFSPPPPSIHGFHRRMQHLRPSSERVHRRVRLLRGGGVTHGAEISAMCGAWGLLRLQTAAPWVFVEVCLCFGPFGPCLQIGI